MSTAFPLKIGGQEFLALPASFSFQKKNKGQLKQLQAGALSPEESQSFMAEMIIHCIKRATPDVDVVALEDELDAISISIASVEIGRQTHRQVSAAYGLDELGGVKAGETLPTSTSTAQ